MPEFNVLNILPAQELIRRIFLERITKAKGLTRVQEMTGDILMPTPAAVLKAAVLLSKGTKSEKCFNDLLVVDVGGATTDVYSITDGITNFSGYIERITEPYEKGRRKRSWSPTQCRVTCGSGGYRRNRRQILHFLEKPAG